MAQANPDGRGKLEMRPWVVVRPQGLYYIGLNINEADAWKIALGWPDESEIAEKKRAGWYAAPATATWAKPDNSN